MRAIAIILAIIFLALAILTLTGVASFLPAIGLDGHAHTKHTILYAILCVLSFIWARFAGNAQPARR